MIVEYILSDILLIQQNSYFGRMRFELGQVLELRCWDRNRANLNLYLDELGIKDFNPYEICRKTHGVMVQDFIWFQFDGENLSFKDVRFKR